MMRIASVAMGIVVVLIWVLAAFGQTAVHRVTEHISYAEALGRTFFLAQEKLR